MLTHQCRTVLKELKKLTNNSDVNFSYLLYANCFCLDDVDITYDYSQFENEIDSIMDTLILEGYVKNTFNSSNFQLTQKALHELKFMIPYIARPLSCLLSWILGIISAVFAEYLIQHLL